MHSEDLTHEDLELIRQLNELATEEQLALSTAEQLRRRVKSLAVDLIRQEIISQARASRMCGVTRTTIATWLDTEPWPDKYDTPRADVD